MKYIAPYGAVDPDAGYVNGNPATGVQGSIPDCVGYEAMLRELHYLITAAGFTPSSADLKQLTRAVRQQVNYIVGAEVGGSPNTLTGVTTANGAPALAEYKLGLTLNVLFPANNTGAMTIAFDGLTATPIKRCNGAAVEADDCIGGMIGKLVYDGTNFQLANYRGITSTTTNNNTYNIDIPYIADTGAVNVITAPFSPAITSRAAGQHIAVKLNHTLTGPSTITVNALAAAPVVRPDGTPTRLNDAFIGEMLLLAFDGTSYQIINQIGVPALPVLLANTDWYVNFSTGHDTNYDGTAATVTGSHGPFKTIGRAIAEVYKYNMNGFNATIHCADATYTETLGLGPLNGSGTVFLVGNTSTPNNILIQGPTSASAVIQNGGTWGMDGFRIASGTGANIGDEMSCITIQGGQFIPGRLNFGAAVSTHFRVSGNSAVNFNGPNCIFHILGSAAAHIGVGPGGTILSGTYAPNLPTVVIDNAVSFQTFISANSGGVAQVLYASITNPGNVTGAKFVASLNGVINSNGSGINYYPGSTAGITQTGGQYT